MKNTLIIAGLVSFFISMIMGPAIIPVLRRLKAGQTEREDGPESHKGKTGTPTIGALIFLTAFFIVSVAFLRDYKEILPILLVTLAFSINGFLDDFIKVVLKRSEGLTPIQKMAVQVLISAGYAVWSYFSQGKCLSVLIPFAGGKTLEMGWWGIPILMFIIIGTVNGSNFTDGVDGLEASVTAALCGVFFIASIAMKVTGITILSTVMFGALLGFLLYNVNKAKVFMGDTGSLALGGFVAVMAHSLGLDLYLPIIALIYFVEVVSVILQVGYFKLTHGKRLFRMAPIHHHFELGGWSETRVVGIFTIVTIIVGAVSLLFIPM